MKTATEILGDCTCSEAYTGRKLLDPQCVRCNYGQEVEALLQEGHALRAEVERLKGVLNQKPVYKPINDSDGGDAWYAWSCADWQYDVRQRAERENERLKAALREIAEADKFDSILGCDECGDRDLRHYCDIACAALTEGEK